MKILLFFKFLLTSYCLCCAKISYTFLDSVPVQHNWSPNTSVIIFLQKFFEKFEALAASVNSFSLKKKNYVFICTMNRIPIKLTKSAIGNTSHEIFVTFISFLFFYYLEKSSIASIVTFLQIFIFIWHFYFYGTIIYYQLFILFKIDVLSCTLKFL